MVEHADLLLERERNPPVNCLSSRSGAIVKGDTTSQADIDDLVGASLARFVVDPEAIPDHDLCQGQRHLSQHHDRPHHQISPAATKVARLPLLGKSYDELQALADHSRKEINFIESSSITADGTCAFVKVSIHFTMPHRKGAYVRAHRYWLMDTAADATRARHVAHARVTCPRLSQCFKTNVG